MPGALTWDQCGMYANAETLWRTTLARNPDAWLAHNNYGYILAHRGQTDDAIAEYREALRINPADASSHYSLGNVLFRQGRLDEAIAHYREALQVNPAYMTAHINLGNALQQKGQIVEAIAEFREALRINPAYAPAYINLGNALQQQGQTAEAVEEMQKAIDLQPGNVAMQNTLAWLLATAPQTSQRNGPRALMLALKANQATGGNNPAILRTLAAAYAESGQFANAAETAERALQLAQIESNAGSASALRRDILLYEAGHRFEGAP
jgi:superkiller protein 3